MTELTASNLGLSSRLEALVLRSGRMVRRVGRGHGLAGADVGEVGQDVRIRLWRARSGQLEALSAAYIHRTAVSAALDIIRRGRGHREVPLSSRAEAVPSIPSPHDGVAAGELAGQVAAAVAGLVPSRRPVVRMYLQGYEREEIARLLGWSEAKTRNLLYRGLADLRATLSAKGIRPGSEP